MPRASPLTTGTAGRRQVGAHFASQLERRSCRAARTDDGDGLGIQRGNTAGNPEHRRRVGNRRQQCGVAFVNTRDGLMAEAICRLEGDFSPTKQMAGESWLLLRLGERCHHELERWRVGAELDRQATKPAGGVPAGATRQE